MNIFIVHSNYDEAHLLEMKDVILTDYKIDYKEQEIILNYIHSQNEYEYSKGEEDVDSFIWYNNMPFSTSAEQEGICINGVKYLVGNKTFDDYVSKVEPLLEDEIVEGELSKV